jgi:hypothetical protein
MLIEFEFLRSIFYLNGFPASLVFTQIKKFMLKRYSEVAPEHDSRKVIYCSFLYLGPGPKAMSRELKILFNRYFPNVNHHILLVNNFTIGSFFMYKDVLPLFICDRPWFIKSVVHNVHLCS